MKLEITEQDLLNAFLKQHRIKEEDTNNPSGSNSLTLAFRYGTSRAGDCLYKTKTFTYNDGSWTSYE